MKRIFLYFFCFLFITTIVLAYTFSPLVEVAKEHYLQKQITTYYRSLVKGIIYMVSSDLQRFPEEKWAERMDTVRPNFGFPVNLKKETDIDLSAEERQQLDRGVIVVKGHGERFYQKVEHSDWVVALGPVEDFNPRRVLLDVIIWAALIIVVAILTIIWALPFGRKLLTISAAARAFGNAEFDTRAKVPPRSILAPLANTFNSMADHIQQLIACQRELTNAVSHELRTPISRIRFGLEMVNSATKVSDRKHYLTEILKDVDELDGLVTESLTYARFDQGGLQLEWQQRQMDSWLRSIAQRALKGSPHINFNCINRLSPPDRHAWFEPRYMDRAVGNLFRNAAVHAKSRVELTIEADGEHCLIHVDDDGPGIPEADRSRVFDAFFRIDASRSRESGGFGLGLAIVSRVVDCHGGSARVTQAPLGGARFTIRWPGFSSTQPIIEQQKPI